jgi:hypothetical protein
MIDLLIAAPRLAAEIPTNPIVIDFTPLANLITNALIGGIEHVLSPLPIEFEKWVLEGVQSLLGSEGPGNLLTHIPIEDTTASGDVLQLWRQGLLVQVGLIALVLVINGYRIVHGTADFSEVMIRVGILVFLGQTVIFWSSGIFTIINFLSNDISATVLDIREQTLPNDLVMGLTLLIAGIMALFAWIKGAVGIVFLKVLLVSAPYLFTLSAIPKLEGLMSWWLEEFTTWTLRPFMVALVLRLGLGIAINNTGGMQFLFAIVAFWLAYTMDTRIRRFSVGVWGSMAQVSMLSRGTKAIAGAFGLNT